METPFRQATVDSPIAALLIDMAHHGFRPSVPEPATVVGGAWGELELREHDAWISVDDEALRLTIDTRATKMLLKPLLRMMKVSNQPVSLTLANAHKVVADMARLPELRAEANVQLYHWNWITSRTPSLWIGRMRGQLPSIGNLRLVERARSNTWMVGSEGWRLDGHGDWYILPTASESEHSVLFVPNGRIDREAVIHDILCMEFVFGTSLRLGHLIGVDESRRFAAAISTGHLLRPIGVGRTPVPDSIEEVARTIPLLFRLVATKLHSEGLEPLILAISSYLDSIYDHLDGGYLKAQVGLEAFASRLVKKKGELVLDDATAYPEWRLWVKSLDSQIKAFVNRPDSVKIVKAKFTSAVRAPSSRNVESVLKRASITVPKECSDEIRKRNYPAHGLLMNHQLNQYDFSRDVRRLEMIQTLLAALVAVYVGYKGPIKGYNVDKHGARPSPDWWPSAPLARQRLFSAERTSDASSPPQLRA